MDITKSLLVSYVEVHGDNNSFLIVGERKPTTINVIGSREGSEADKLWDRLTRGPKSQYIYQWGVKENVIIVVYDKSSDGVILLIAQKKRNQKLPINIIEGEKADELWKELNRK